jgi:hypothetical protein
MRFGKFVNNETLLPNLPTHFITGEGGRYKLPSFSKNKLLLEIGFCSGKTDFKQSLLFCACLGVAFGEAWASAPPW